MTGQALESKYVWLVPPSWGRLHYIPEIDDTDDATSGSSYWETYWDDWDRYDPDRPRELHAVCGLRARFQLPGILSRMGLDRCAHCCDTLGIERGHGAPMNERWEKSHVETVGG